MVVSLTCDHVQWTKLETRQLSLVLASVSMRPLYQISDFCSNAAILQHACMIQAVSIYRHMPAGCMLHTATRPNLFYLMYDVHVRRTKKSCLLQIVLYIKFSICDHSSSVKAGRQQAHRLRPASSTSSPFPRRQVVRQMQLPAHLLEGAVGS